MKTLQGLKVAILVANGFEQVEMEKPRQALEEAGAKTYLISPESSQVQGWNHFEKSDFFKVDISLEDAKVEDFDALLLPGGVINPDHLRTLPNAVELIKAIARKNKPVATICHGPSLLINAGLVKGRKITSWPSIKIDLVNAGAEWIDEPAVVDGLILTSRNPDDIPRFNQAMIRLFGSVQSSRLQR